MANEEYREAWHLLQTRSECEESHFSPDQREAGHPPKSELEGSPGGSGSGADADGDEFLSKLPGEGWPGATLSVGWRAIVKVFGRYRPYGKP